MGCTCAAMAEVVVKITQLNFAKMESAFFQTPYNETNSSLTEMKEGIIKTASSDVVSD